MGRPATDYKIVVSPWESGIDHTSHATFPWSDSMYVCICVSTHVYVCAWVGACMHMSQDKAILKRSTPKDWPPGTIHGQMLMRFPRDNLI